MLRPQGEDKRKRQVIGAGYPPAKEDVRCAQVAYQIDDTMSGDLDVHHMVDNLSTQKHAWVRGGCAERPRSPLHHTPMHHTPTSSSWRNQMDRRFGNSNSAEYLARRVQQHHRTGAPH